MYRTAKVGFPVILCLVAVTFFTCGKDSPTSSSRQGVAAPKAAARPQATTTGPQAASTSPQTTGTAPSSVSATPQSVSVVSDSTKTNAAAAPDTTNGSEAPKDNQQPSGQTGQVGNAGQPVVTGQAGQATGQATSPDYVIQSVELSETSLSAGQRFSMSATVKNQGADVSGFELTRLRFYQSSDATISTADTELGDRPIPPSTRTRPGNGPCPSSTRRRPPVPITTVPASTPCRKNPTSRTTVRRR